MRGNRNRNSRSTAAIVRKQCDFFDSPTEAEAEAEADAEEKGQDKIQFVFSHEREGLLAIRTFALEQLQSVRSTLDGRGRADHACGGVHEFGFDSEVNLLALGNDDVMPSSDDDDEDQLQRCWTCDLPVFGDSANLESALVPFSQMECFGGSQKPSGVLKPWHGETTSKALTVCKPNPNLNPGASETTTTPVFTLAPEFRSSLHRPFLPLWTDAVKEEAEEEDDDDDDDEEGFCSTRLCGLFTKEKTSDITSRRDLKYDLMAIETKTKRLPILGKLAKLWRSSCTPSGRIAPRRNPSPRVGSEVVPCFRKGAELKRLPKYEGKRIEDDEDCEFSTFLFNMSQ